MILRMVRDDLAWQVGAGVALANLAVLPLIPASPGPGTLLLAEASGLCFALARLQYSRASLFEISLPIPARQIFLSRVVSLLGLVWLPLLAAAAVILFRWGPASIWLADVGKGAVITSLGVLLLLSVRMPERSLPLWLTAALWLGVAGAGGAAWYLLPTWTVLLLFGAANAAVFLRAWGAIPSSFQVAPLAATRASVHSALPGILPRAWGPIVRSVRPLQAIGMFLVMALLAPSGGFLSFYAFMGLSTYTQVRERLRWLATLAISPRRLLLIMLAASVGPLLGGILLGIGLGPWNPLAHPSKEPPPFVSPGAVLSYGPDADIPLEFWRIAPGGQTPLIRAPWGETSRPLTLTILGTVFYNPYSAYRPTHPFVEWQWMQASQDLHLGRIPLSQYWLTRSTIKPVVFTGDIGFHILCLAALLFICLYLVFLVELNNSHKLRRPSQLARRILLCGLLALPVVASFVAMFFSPSADVPLAKAAIFLFERLFGENFVLLVMVAAAPVVGMYWLAERQFRRAELLGPLVKPEAA